MLRVVYANQLMHVSRQRAGGWLCSVIAFTFIIPLLIYYAGHIHFEFHFLKLLLKSPRHSQYRTVASSFLRHGNVTHIAVENGSSKGQLILSVI